MPFDEVPPQEPTESPSKPKIRPLQEQGGRLRHKIHALIQALNLSVRKIVLAIGAATATQFLLMPRKSHAAPVSRVMRVMQGTMPSSVLNISFLTTSKGLVSTAPAMPAVTATLADFSSTALLSFGSTGASHCPM